MSVAELTYADAARIVRELELDTRYRTGTGLGPTIVEFLQHQRLVNQAPSTLENREVTLRLLAVRYADLGPDDFDGILGREPTRLLRAFLAERWGDAEPGTLRTRTSAVRTYFQFLEDETIIQKSPARALKLPRRPDTRRRPHPRDELQKLIGAQPRANHRLALMLLARHGIRRGGLWNIQLGDFHLPHLTVYEKGSQEHKLRLLADVADVAERYLQDRATVNPNYRREYLLYWHKTGKVGSWPFYSHEIISEDTQRQLSYAGIGKWWYRCLDRAGLPHFAMHELRHSAGTAFHLEHGDYELTRQFLRHKHASTTATYIHVPSAQLDEAIARTTTWED